MKCPYTIFDIVQTNVNEFVYDESGNCIRQTHRLAEQKDLMDCLREECAAWRDGRCEYRGAVN